MSKKEKRQKEDVTLVDENGVPLNADSMKEMKYHYKQTKKAWRKANRKSAWPLRIIIIVLILSIIGAGLMLMKKQKEDASMVQEDLQVVPVTATTPELRDMVSTYKGNGDVVASSTVDVYPDTSSGKVTRIDVELGDVVRKDQVLLYVDPSRPGQNYAPSPVKAPVGGTVTGLNVEVGSMISMQMPIATIGNLSRLQVVTHIPEKYVTNVKIGQETMVSLISWDGKFITGRISEISPVVDPVSRTMKVVINLPAGENRIKAGMFVRTDMVTERFPNVLTLPAQSVVERFDDQFVYVIDGDRVERRNIRSGLSVNGIARIDEGLESGELVVVKGTNLLEDGSAISIVEDY